MKAAVSKKYGPPSVVEIMQVDKPVPQENQVRVTVHTTTLNRTDCGLRYVKPYLLS